MWIIFLCHPVIYSRDPVKNTNKISIFYYFLDLVPKPRDDTESVFGSCHPIAITNFYGLPNVEVSKV
ncbi:hypothetical protein RBEAN4_1316 [Rickettsia bellii str. RML An4]|uniref:RPE4 domain protein n=1 Tax=Rickettsia bellii str. RML An4 TaxID=1359193 RepID=A0A0F3QCP9_RICBE|nr:hypothetical protein RBEAN4_1316 [Rickettsia bellii str. RML An4]